MSILTDYNEIERIAFEVYSRTGRLITDRLDNWIEAERLVREWQKSRKKNLKSGVSAKGPKDVPETRPGPEKRRG